MDRRPLEPAVPCPPPTEMGAVLAPWVIPSSTRSLSARFWKLCDALLTAPARPQRGPLGHGKVLLALGTRHFDRPAAALNLVNSLVPGTSAAWSRMALRLRYLPFSCSALRLMAFGTGDTVYRLGGPESSLVLKVERISLGLRRSELVHLARWRRRGFEEVVREYAEVRDVFPDVSFLVLQSPLFGVPAVGAVQQLVAGPFRDLLRDVGDAELEALLVRCPGLGPRIAGFLERTIAMWERGGWIVDLGKDNLVLAGEGDRTRLCYLDVEMKEVSEVRGTFREALYERLIERMRAILARIDLRA
ncbi:MAG: hypothetical protein AB7T31_14660 [Gemmatimonadales bacterium]